MCLYAVLLSRFSYLDIVTYYLFYFSLILLDISAS